jgi:ribosomal protein S27AE
LVKNQFTENAEFDWEEFKNMARLGVRFLDNVLDATDYPLEKIEKISKAWRRIGLGITGLGDALLKLKIRYGSKESVDFVYEMGNVLAESAYNASVDLALQKGSFPAYDSHIGHSGFITRLSEGTQKRIQEVGLRNIGILTTAPTGCLVPESIVSTNDGLYTLEELIPNYKNYEDGTWIPQENLGALNEYEKYEGIRNTFINGFKPTKKISTKSGVNLEGTPNHKFKVLNGTSFDWKKLEDLSVGDNIVYKIGGYEKKDNKRLILPDYAKHPNEKDIRLPEEITAEFAFFLGLYNADGSTHNKGIRINLNHLTNESIEVVELIKNLFNWNSKVVDNGKNCDSVYISSQRLLNFLEINGLIKNKALGIEIPKAVRLSSKESILSYIDGYFYGDGSSSRGTMYIDTYSEKNAQQLAIIMRAVGINSSISVYDKSLDEGSYSNNLSYRIYWKKYGSIGEERAKRYIKKDLKEKVDYLNDYFGKGLFIDEVVAISDSNNYTLDLEVPDGRTYIANSYVSHNTTSLSLGNNCSSGIEPIFSLQYDRSIRQDDDTTKTQTVYDDGWLEYIEYAGYKEGNDLPDYVVVSHNVSITEGIDIQAALQYWIDHSISKTINMPFETTLEQYKDIFMYSWKKGLKGVTSFHEGASMDGILSTKKDDGWRNIEVLKNAMKRPESLPCDIYDITVNKEPVIVLVGKNPDSPYNNAPYEIFYTDNHDDIVDLKRFKEGSIVKVYDGAEKASRYDLLIEGKRSKIVVENLAEVFNDDYASMCRLLSLLMRHQVPLEFIVAQMNKVKKFGTFQKAIARVLKYYIPDGEMISSNKAECPECGGTMVFEGGCTVCSSCGYSTCG